MIPAVLFDVLLVVLLVTYAVYGYRNGFVHALSGFVGLVAGAIVAFFVVPRIGLLVPTVEWRLVVVLASSVALLAGGYALGTGIGRRFGARLKRTALRVIDRVLGALLTIAATALVLSLLATSIASLGIPLLSGVIANSAVLRVIAAATPDPLERALAQVRSTLVTDGLPAITEALGGIVNPPLLPNVDTGGPALTAAAQSVVRITGTAPACSQSQSGSGFVVADDRVVTNAHVVSGVSDPLVETPGGQVLTGTVVYFDPTMDLAVIAVRGLSAEPIPFVDTVADGTQGAIDGYPFGGPFVTSAAEVLSIDTANMRDIYGTSASPREVYTLATTVNEGDSGGPFLTLKGQVAGIVFAKSANTANVGYAMTMAELEPVAAQAPSFTATVDSGACVRG